MAARPDPRRRHDFWPVWRAAGGATVPVYFGEQGEFRAHATRDAVAGRPAARIDGPGGRHRCLRSEEHTSELQSLMRISYAVFCLTKQRPIHPTHTTTDTQ